MLQQVPLFFRNKMFSKLSFALLVSGNLLKIPALAAQLTGSFPLVLELSPMGPKIAPRISIRYSWKSVGVFMFVLRFLLITSYNLYVTICHSAEIAEMFGDWSKTMMFTEGIVQTCSTFGDLFMAIQLIWQRKRLSCFLTNLVTLLQNIWENCADTCKNDKFLMEELGSRHRSTVQIFTWILLVAPLSCITNCLIYFPATVKNIPFWNWRYAGVPNFFIYLELATHFRLLNLLLLITLIFMFQIPLSMLRCHVEYSQNIHAIYSLAMVTVDKLEKLVEEFHSLFSIHLLTATVVTLLSILVVSFNVLVLVMRFADNSLTWYWYQLASLFPWAISLILSFYAICDTSTNMTHEASECIWAFRTHPQLDSLSHEDKQKMLLFVVEKTATRRLVVAPGKLFTLGRHILPTVCLSHHMRMILPVQNVLGRP